MSVSDCDMRPSKSTKLLFYLHPSREIRYSLDKKIAEDFFQSREINKLHDNQEQDSEYASKIARFIKQEKGAIIKYACCTKRGE